ncbi:FkbM family methyltransferase [Rhizobium sp. PL01]|uniref:FkbM family methyltransferase n=1 Tax=Rhizobium sp. PL01 TaxID=3085631 RepID=UPI002981C362|nr:FkbM family methyltransferase [Rhizobium sp. PL01]MDW5318313.1 FkbM family methyltransferase [Rhizobium sp. PL01]
MLKRLLKKVRGSRIPRAYGNPATLDKANIVIERYREIISDPLNLLIAKVPAAGYVDRDKCVILHNGHRVAVEGDLAYYKDFSDILILNRGVHEPLEEYCFQETLKQIKSTLPRMIELGAYWAHYSMWFLQNFPDAQCFMVEPEEINLRCGQNNFRINNYSGEFIKSFVGVDSFQVDDFTVSRKLDRLDILHSDIQGYEVEMLRGGKNFLSEKRVDYVFISTHSQSMHAEVVDILAGYGYRIEVSSDFDNQSTSLDGFILASSPNVTPVFSEFSPLGRLDIAAADPRQLVAYLDSAP